MKKRVSRKDKISAKTKKGIDACIEHENECKTLVVQGTKYRTLYTTKYTNRKKWVYPDEKLIMSFIPGTIIDIFIEKGQEVKEGDKALVFEAMKMMNTVTIPYDGIIKKVHIEKDQRMPKGIVMFEFE
jgi:biotin carboxyl carrier protein